MREQTLGGAMVLLGMGLIAIVVAAAMGVAASGLLQRRHTAADGRSMPSPVQVAVQAMRRRAVAALIAAVTVFIGILLWNSSVPHLLGLPLGMAPTLAASAGLLTYALTPIYVVPVSTHDVRSAPLSTRGPGGAFCGYLGIVWGATIVVTIGYLVFAGLTSSADEFGRSRVIAFTGERVGSSAGPYPGWFYAVPMLIGLVVMAISTLVAVRRVSAAPAFPDSAHAAVDVRWRQASARVLLAISLAAVLFTLGGATLTGASATGRALISGETSAPWLVVAWGAGALGLMAVIASVATLGFAARWTASISRPDLSVPR